MSEPLTDERLAEIKANNEQRKAAYSCDVDYHHYEPECHDEIDALLAEVERLRSEVRMFRRVDSLIREDLKAYVTDCSTPTFQLARNVIAEVERLRRQMSDWDRILRCSAGDEGVACDSPVSAVQNKIVFLEYEVERLRDEVSVQSTLLKLMAGR